MVEDLLSGLMEPIVQKVPFWAFVTDIAPSLFVALSEDRPYRGAMPVGEAMEIIEDLARNANLDHQVVALAKKHSEEICSCVLAVRGPTRQDYDAFLDSSFFRAFQ